MSSILPYILIVFWFFLLIKWADLLVDGASSLAKKLRISDLVIWLTIVAFGTSAPELIVNVIWSVNNANDMVLWNIIGSNIANILLILGLSASIKALAISPGTAWKEIPFSLLWALVLAVMINDQLFSHGVASSLSGADGIILLCFFIIFLYYMFGVAQSQNYIQEGEVKTMSHVKSLTFVAAGIAWLTFGGNFVVNNATSLATMRWWSEKLIWLTILAVGTSLPELVTSLVAVTKSRASIAVGNIVWSNIFNVFFVLWITSIISPVTFDPKNNVDIIINLCVHILLFWALFIDKKRVLTRWEGIVFVILYVAFLWGMLWLG